MVESQFRFSAPKLLDRLNTLLERVNRYITEVEVKEREYNTKNPSFKFQNLYSFALQEPRKERNRLVELQQAVSVQVDVSKSYDGWDTTVLLTTSDSNLIFKWTHQYLSSKNTIEHLEKYK